MINKYGRFPNMKTQEQHYFLAYSPKTTTILTYHIQKGKTFQKI
jgi:hypothetical protein